MTKTIDLSKLDFDKKIKVELGIIPLIVALVAQKNFYNYHLDSSKDLYADHISLTKKQQEENINNIGLCIADLFETLVNALSNDSLNEEEKKIIEINLDNVMKTMDQSKFKFLEDEK